MDAKYGRRVHNPFVVTEHCVQTICVGAGGNLAVSPAGRASNARMAIAITIVVFLSVSGAAVVFSGTAQTAASGSSAVTTSASAYEDNPLCTSAPCAPMITGWVHTAAGSTDVYDSSGRPVPLVGVNVDGLDFGTGNPSTAPDPCGKGWGIAPTSYANVADWGFNFVRIPITWENIEPTAPTQAANGTWIHHWNTAFLKELDYVTAQFGKNHVAVIYDFAQVDVSAAFQDAPEKTQGGECEGWGNPTWLYPSVTTPTTSQELASATCSFFNDESLVGTRAPPPIEAMEAAESMLASRYASNSTVIGIDMFNEPWTNSSCGSAAAFGNLLTGFYTKMGDAIASANPHLLLVFEEPPPGLMPSSPVISVPPKVANSMYSFHIYTSDWGTAEPYVQAYLRNAESWGVPVWMGEFDAFEAGCTGVNCRLDPSWQADTEALLSYSNSHGINWAYFSYYSLGTPLRTPVPHSEILTVLRGEIPTAASIGVSCRPSSVVVGSYTLCRASATGNKPTGKITWTASNAGKFTRSACVLSGGSCSVDYDPYSGGMPTVINASYSGDGQNPPSDGSFSLAVTMKASRTTISCKLASVPMGSPTSCTAVVTGYEPTGTVGWSQTGGTGGVSFVSSTCALSKGRCSVTFTGTAAGTVVIQAVYGGDAGNAGSSRTRSLTVT